MKSKLLKNSFSQHSGRHITYGGINGGVLVADGRAGIKDHVEALEPLLQQCGFLWALVFYVLLSSFELTNEYYAIQNQQADEPGRRPWRGCLYSGAGCDERGRRKRSATD